MGGCSANVAVDLARLGLRPAVVGRVGADPLGAYLREALAAAQVDVSLLSSQPSERTSATLVVNVQGEDRRFIHDVGGNAALDGSEVTAGEIARARAVYVGGFLIMPRLTGANVARIFKLARQRGIPTVLDVVLAGPAPAHQLEAALPWTDVFLPNSDEARLLTGETDPRRQAEWFRNAGAKTVVITCGKEGAYLLSDTARLHAPAHAVPFVDGTGSGDAFAAGYIWGLLEQLPESRCLELGSALGASCVRATGATTGVLTREEVGEFLLAHPLPLTGW